MNTPVGTNERQLVLVLEGTAALGPYWSLLRAEYIDKIIRAFSGNELGGQKLSGTSAEMALVVFYGHGPHSACSVQRSGWTANLDVFLQWLSSISFSAGGFGEAAIAEGLAEALMMCSSGQAATQMTQVIDRQKHCVLVVASNPHPLPTPVPRPPVHNSTQQNANPELQAQQWLADAETVAKAFAQCLVSLSVIAPKQLPMLKSVFHAGKRNPAAATDVVIENIKHSQHLVLLSDSFMDARSALTCSGAMPLTANANLIKADSTTTAPHALSVQPSVVNARVSSGQTVNGVMAGYQQTSNRVIPGATVKTEVTSYVSMASAPGLPHVTSTSLLHSSSQGVPGQYPPLGLSTQETKPNADITDGQDFKLLISNTRSATASTTNVSLLNNISQARQVMSSPALTGASTLGLQTTGSTPVGMQMSNMLANGMGSTAISTAQAVLATGQPGITSTATSVGLVGVGQVAPNVAQSTFGAGTNLVGTSSLRVGQQGSSVNSGITGMQGVVGLGQSVPGLGPVGMTAGAPVGQSGVGINPNVLGGLGSVGVTSGAGTMIPKSGLPQSVQLGLQGLGGGNGAVGGNLQLSSNVSASQQPAAIQTKYTKVWTGELGGQRQGKPVFICKLEGYRNITSSETLAADWPLSMQIIRLISQDHITSKHYQGKADFLIFRPLNSHGFLAQLAEKKLSAVIQLPTQTLLLSSSDKPGRMIGMLFPGDTVVFKPQLPSQPQQQQQPQGVPSAIGQAFAQSQLTNQARPQLMSQGQFQGQGPATMPGTGFLA